MDNTTENWKLFYETSAASAWDFTKDRKRYWWVSDHGRIKVTNNYNDKVKYPSLSLTGGHPDRRYLAISHNFGGKYVHKIVANNFLPPSPVTEDKWCVDHIDNDRLNNHVSNLQWLTHGENIKKSYKWRIRQEILKEMQDGE